MKKHTVETPPISPETTAFNAKKWLTIIRYGESGTVIQMQDDCEYRVTEIIQNPRLLKTYLGPYYKKYLLAYLPIDQKNLPEAIRQTLVSMCIKKHIGTIGLLNDYSNQELVDELGSRGYEIGIFISHITPLFTQNRRQELFDLELLVRTSKNLSLLAFSERDVTHPDYSYLTDKCSFLFDHVIFYPFYTTNDSEQFLTHYAQQWHMTLPELTRRAIIEACGGYLWLLHDIARTIRDNPLIQFAEACNTPTLQQKLISIWSKFTPEEQRILKAARRGVLTETDTVSHEYSYLVKLRALTKHDSAYSLGIPLLSLAIDREARIKSLTCTSDAIFIGNDDITNFFSGQEQRFLRTLISARSTIVTRDIVASALWGDNWEQKYSDWAIDRVAHRVRDKLRTYGHNDALVKTIKRKGFLFS